MSFIREGLREQCDAPVSSAATLVSATNGVSVFQSLKGIAGRNVRKDPDGLSKNT